MNGVNPKIKDADDLNSFSVTDIIIYANDLRNRHQSKVDRCNKLERYRQCILQMSKLEDEMEKLWGDGK